MCDFESSGASAYCAIVNDKDNKILLEIINHLGLLESGALKSLNDRVPCYNIHLDTKYYTCDVSMLSYQNIGKFFTDCAKQQADTNFQIQACLFCALREELTPDLLSLISRCCSLLGKADVKALIVHGNESDGVCHGVYPTDEVLNKFAICHGVEVISLSNGMRNACEEEGLTGIPRAIEAIETVSWPNLKRKPNPVNGKEHRDRIRRLIETDIDEDVGQETMKSIGKKIAEPKPQDMSTDYPDSDDEDAIIDLFDKPSKQEFASPHQFGHGTNEFNTNPKISLVFGNLSEVQGSTSQQQAPIQRTR